MRSPLLHSDSPFAPIWSGFDDSTLRPCLMVAREGSGYRPMSTTDFGSGGGGGSTTTNGQVGISGSNGLSANIVTFGGLNALPVVIISGQTLVSGANITLTGVQTTDAILDYNQFAPLGYNGGMTTSNWVSFSVLSSYVIPLGKTLKIDGYAVRNAVSVEFLAAVRELMYGFCATGNGTPPSPTLTGVTVTGFNGLNINSTYIYRTVSVNPLGSSIAGPTGMITLSGGQNAVNYTVGASPLNDNSYFEVYRTLANGSSGTETFLASTSSTFFQDIIPDSELSLDTPPITATSSGIFSGYAYPSGTAPRHVVLQSFINIPAPIDVVYKNINRQTRRMRIDQPTSFTELSPTSGTPNVARKIARKTQGHEWDDVGINQILHVGMNTANQANANFVIYGYNPLFYIQPSSGNSWETEYFPKTMAVPAGKEVVISVVSTPAIASTGRVDLILFGRLI